MNRHRLTAHKPEQYEVWAWWDEPSKSFYAQVQYIPSGPDRGNSVTLQVGADVRITTVQALCEALQDYASLSIGQKVQLLQDKAATPAPFSEQVRKRVQQLSKSLALLWRLRPWR